LPVECIYAIAIDQVYNIWCSTNKGILCLDPNGNILQLKKEDGLQENEFNTNVVFQSPDGEIYFGGVNGATSFYPDEVIKVVDSVKILITGIRVNHQQKFTDTAIWNLKQIELQHDENAISFDLVAMGSLNPDQYVYQYRLVGMDNEWIQKSDMQSIRYLLPPGKYTLQLYASRLFNKNAKPLKELRIIIHPPFYKTWWFATIIGLILLGSLIFGINRYNRSKYIGRLRELENEHRIQMERERISRDLHDNIGAFANAVLYKAQTIGENPQVDLEVIEDLKFASKDIILSLRETIWAFKKESYSSQECMLRIRNFIQTLHRYYENINIHINENHESEKTLSYSRALDLVRLVQEAVTNSLKHAKPKNIMVTSTIDKDKWIVEVKDDGMGFDVVRVNLGNGLDNMKKRAVKSGFEFSLFSKVGEGTRITLVIS
jgi:signal transduction histidine kinase